MHRRYQDGYESEAVLFDMDGTLIDSKEAVERVWLNFANRYHLSFDDILKVSHGCRTEETVRLFAPPNSNVEEITSELLRQACADTVGIKAMTGAKKLLQQLPMNQWAIVTSASRNLAIARLKAAQLPIPHILIAAEDVIHGKPAPDGYLAAATALGVTPQKCIVVEDATPGILSARAANMSVIGVGHDLHFSQEAMIFHASQLNEIHISFHQSVSSEMKQNTIYVYHRSNVK